MYKGLNLFNAFTLVVCLFVCFSGSQVTKKLVSAKKNHGTQEFYNAAQAAAKRQSDREQNLQHSPKVDQTLQHNCNPNTSSSSPDPVGATPTTVTPTTTSQHTPPKQNAPSRGNTPGSASKRRHRKLAVNFEAAKVSE